MTHLDTGVSLDPLRLLREVKQFLFFIEYRLEVCDSAADALEALPDVHAAFSRLDQAMAQLAVAIRTGASHPSYVAADRIVRPLPRAQKARSPHRARS